MAPTFQSSPNRQAPRRAVDKLVSLSKDGSTRPPQGQYGDRPRPQYGNQNRGGYQNRSPNGFQNRNPNGFQNRTPGGFQDRSQYGEQAPRRWDSFNKAGRGTNQAGGGGYQRTGTGPASFGRNQPFNGRATIDLRNLGASLATGRGGRMQNRGGRMGSSRGGRGGGRPNRRSGLPADNGSNAAISSRVETAMSDVVSARKAEATVSFGRYDEFDVGDAVADPLIVPLPRQEVAAPASTSAGLVEASAVSSLQLLARAAAPLGVAGRIGEHFGPAVRRPAHPVAPQYAGFVTLDAPVERSTRLVPDPVSDPELRQTVKLITAGPIEGFVAVPDGVVEPAKEARRIATLNSAYRPGEVDGLAQSISRTLKITGVQRRA